MLGFNKYSSLFAYGLLICVAHILWFNLVPLVTLVEDKYAVSESMALLPIAVFPVFYVLFSLHAGKIIDKYNYPKVVAVSAIIMSTFALLRFFAESFWGLLVMQSVIAISQSYLINAISKFVADWFSVQHITLATGILSMTMFLGMALGAAATPAMVSHFGFEKTLLLMGVLSCISSLVFIFFANRNPENPMPNSTQIRFSDYIQLAQNKNIRLLLIFAFLSLGTFNALSTWMESIYLEYGLSLEQAGLITGLLIIGGIVGSPVLCALSDKMNNRKFLLLFCAFFAALLIYPLCQNLPLSILMTLALATGFIFLPGLPILLAEAESQVGAEKSGIIASFVLLTGNIGAFVMIFITSFISQQASSWQAGILLMASSLLLASLVALYNQANTKLQALV